MIFDFVQNGQKFDLLMMLRRGVGVTVVGAVKTRQEAKRWKDTRNKTERELDAFDRLEKAEM